MKKAEKEELLKHAKNLGLNVGKRMTTESLKAQINDAEQKALAGKPTSNATPMPDKTTLQSEPGPQVEVPKVQLPLKKKYRTTAWIDFGSGQLRPGTEVELDKTQADHLLKYDAVEPL